MASFITPSVNKGVSTILHRDSIGGTRMVIKMYYWKSTVRYHVYQWGNDGIVATWYFPRWLWKGSEDYDCRTNTGKKPPACITSSVTTIP